MLLTDVISIFQNIGDEQEGDEVTVDLINNAISSFNTQFGLAVTLFPRDDMGYNHPAPEEFFYSIIQPLTMAKISKFMYRDLEVATAFENEAFAASKAFLSSRNDFRKQWKPANKSNVIKRNVAKIDFNNPTAGFVGPLDAVLTLGGEVSYSYSDIEFKVQDSTTLELYSIMVRVAKDGVNVSDIEPYTTSKTDNENRTKLYLNAYMQDKRYTLTEAITAAVTAALSDDGYVYNSLTSDQEVFDLISADMIYYQCFEVIYQKELVTAIANAGS